MMDQQSKRFFINFFAWTMAFLILSSFLDEWYFAKHKL